MRCHLHTITRRAEDRLTFDLQREVAARMNYSDRPGKSAVERFMQYFFLQAKVVGNLTGVFLAQLDEQFALPARGLLAGFRAKARTLKGYKIFGGRTRAPADDWFAADPVRLIEIFVLADREGLEIHPETMRLIARDAALIRESVRQDKRANELFMELLTSPNDPEKGLRAFNEAGVFGRFVTEFGRVNAQMQFDMYHHYTVDEHTIRAIGLLSRIEKGELKDDHPRWRTISSTRSIRGALHLGAAARHRQGPGRRPFGAGRGDRAEAVPAPGAGRERDRAGELAGAHPPADERHRLQARPVGLQDDQRFRRGGAVGRSPAPADHADDR